MKKKTCGLASSPATQGPDPSLAETEIALRVLSTGIANQQLTLGAAQAGQTQQSLAMPPSARALPTATGEAYQQPYALTITVRVSDINRGMAVYYHIRDKNSGVTSEGQVIDLHRRTGNTRDATIIGGGSFDQNLQFPPLMGESYFVYQIISDDGLYRSPTYSDISFYPCAQ